MKKKTFRSKLEESVADILDKVGAKYEYETHKVAYTIQHHYNPDFCLVNGVMLETKGYWDSEDRRKIKAVMRDNPDIDLRMVFQAPSIRSARNPKQPMPNGVRSMASSGQQHMQSP
jgi:hypothetical protein